MNLEKINKGLNGVTVDYSAISKVMPETNSLTYRGYAVEELCEHCSFEEVAYLLIYGELPKLEELEEFQTKEREKRKLSVEQLQRIHYLPEAAHPMDTLRTCVSFLGCEDPRLWDNSEETSIDKFLNLLAKIPTIIAGCYRHAANQDIIIPKQNISMAENFFYMCFGEIPAKEVVKALEVSLILYAEHSFNASTFTARVIASTTSDMYSAVTGAIGALKGPLHGGANEQVMHMLMEIGSASKAERWLDNAFAEKKKVMGFGHRVYKNGDSRVPTMKKYANLMADYIGDHQWRDISEVLEQKMIKDKGIYPNLDFPAGPAYYLMGFDIDVFTPIFVMSRITGWCAHIMEQYADNKLIRPLSAYSGVEQRKVVV
ncbi:bifunctional 2-methylcitrate synthase/citrate synthase [Reichenbachiella versicolor]|uniref:bifunctional 2-methylcitrate synthase/citrate synthase n=1 Tax=Reichenbachiella versicolor TaxID=1821036 RepID=UPI000D6E8F01|nr:bifunctional 2-methylcitrate synthase/citrate synthase [Reichenbachiella versicolor]